MDLSLSKLPWYVQIGLFVAVAAAGMVAFYIYFEAPMRADFAARQTRLNALRLDINKGLEAAKRLSQFRREVAELEARLGNLRAVLPSEKDAADLLRNLQAVASQSNLTIKSFRPAPVVNKELHAEWPIALELDGTYHNLALFFDRVGKFTRIINITGVDIKGKDTPGRVDPNLTISSSCTATTFVLLDKPAPGKDGKGDKAAPSPGVPAAPGKKVA